MQRWRRPASAQEAHAGRQRIQPAQGRRAQGRSDAQRVLRALRLSSVPTAAQALKPAAAQAAGCWALLTGSPAPRTTRGTRGSGPTQCVPSRRRSAANCPAVMPRGSRAPPGTVSARPAPGGTPRTTRARASQLPLSLHCKVPACGDHCVWLSTGSIDDDQTLCASVFLLQDSRLSRRTWVSDCCGQPRAGRQAEARVQTGHTGGMGRQGRGLDCQEEVPNGQTEDYVRDSYRLTPA